MSVDHTLERLRAVRVARTIDRLCHILHTSGLSLADQQMVVNGLAIGVEQVRHHGPDIAENVPGPEDLGA